MNICNRSNETVWLKRLWSCTNTIHDNCSLWLRGSTDADYDNCSLWLRGSTDADLNAPVWFCQRLSRDRVSECFND